MGIISDKTIEEIYKQLEPWMEHAGVPINDFTRYHAMQGYRNLVAHPNFHHFFKDELLRIIDMEIDRLHAVLHRPHEN